MRRHNLVMLRLPLLALEPLNVHITLSDLETTNLKIIRINVTIIAGNLAFTLNSDRVASDFTGSLYHLSIAMQSQ